MTFVAGFGNFLCRPKSLSMNGARSRELYDEDRQMLGERLPGNSIWSQEKCHRAVSILSTLAFVALIGVTVVQLVLALQVRDYSCRLWREKRKMREALRGEMHVYEHLLT